jgi:hypothetical protein
MGLLKPSGIILKTKLKFIRQPHPEYLLHLQTRSESIIALQKLYIIIINDKRVDGGSQVFIDFHYDENFSGIIDVFGLFEIIGEQVEFGLQVYVLHNFLFINYFNVSPEFCPEFFPRINAECPIR